MPFCDYFSMRKNTNPIRHFATVVKVTPQYVRVRLEDVAAEDCGGCRLAGMCNKSADMQIDVSVMRNAARLHVGERIVLSAAQRVQGLAVLWTIGLPLAIFVAAILGLSGMECPGWAVALTALTGVGIYYVILGIAYRYLFKREIWQVSSVEE